MFLNALPEPAAKDGDEPLSPRARHLRFGQFVTRSEFVRVLKGANPAQRRLAWQREDLTAEAREELQRFESEV